jgi:deoxyhypusine synthase
LIPSNTIPDTPVIKGYEFSQGSDLDGIMNAMLTSGFQATALGQAVNEINRMVSIYSTLCGIRLRSAADCLIALVLCTVHSHPTHHPMLLRTLCGAMQLEWRLSDEPVTDDTDPDHAHPEFRKSVRAKIFLGYTSNLISAGVREQIK